MPVKPPLPEQRRRPAADASGAADYLLERRAVLDRTLQHDDGSAMSSIMRRMPPHPVALVMIESRPTHERFVKLLGNANIELDEVATTAAMRSRTLQLAFTPCCSRTV